MQATSIEKFCVLAPADLGSNPKNRSNFERPSVDTYDTPQKYSGLLFKVDLDIKGLLVSAHRVAEASILT